MNTDLVKLGYFHKIAQEEPTQNTESRDKLLSTLLGLGILGSGGLGLYSIYKNNKKKNKKYMENLFGEKE